MDESNRQWLIVADDSNDDIVRFDWNKDLFDWMGANKDYYYTISTIINMIKHIPFITSSFTLETSPIISATAGIYL